MEGLVNDRSLCRQGQIEKQNEEILLRQAGRIFVAAVIRKKDSSWRVHVCFTGMMAAVSGGKPLFEGGGSGRKILPFAALCHGSA
jgi:hypothetical protein